MKRGDIVIFTGKGDFSGKPRPGLIVQSNDFNGIVQSVLACPITTVLTGNDLARIAIRPLPENGLRKPSEIEIDKMQAVWTRWMRSTIGVASPDVMASVDNALRRWLSL